MTTLYEVLDGARDDLKERWTDYRSEFDQDEGDVIYEVADGHVPIYTHDLMKLAAEDCSLATEEPEIGPAFDGSPTPVNIVAANIYERITADLWTYLEELKGSDCLECGEVMAEEGSDFCKACEELIAAESD